MIEPMSASTIMGAVALGAAKKAGELSFSKLFEKLLSLTFLDGEKNQPSYLGNAIAHYERQTFDRCINVKTLINRDTPIDILSIYVPVRFRNGEEIIDQYNLIDNIYNLKKITISGTGGSGKSMFMKYLWLSMFENNRGKIPIFVELRSFNDITSDDFLVFLFASVFTGVENTSGIEFFKKMLTSGRFSFILDGFDEVSEDRKKTLSKQITQISQIYSDNIFVISTRPLDSILNWSTFHNYNVCPMLKEDVLLLISKIDFPIKVKRKFSKAIKDTLFESHRSFLEIPLLATIMLFLFNEIADVPEEMHVFYDQAFWTLFRRHDASKDAFDRKLNCGLPMESFKSAIAAFCFFSYIGGKTNLTDSEIFQYAQKSSDFLGFNIDCDSFKRDLVNNICFLQLDGIDYIFIHRTFQEYFAALFVSGRPEREWLEAALMLPNNSAESAIKILFSINKSRFDSAILYRIIELFEQDEIDGDNLITSIYDREGAKPTISLFHPNYTKSRRIQSYFLFVDFYESRIYKFLLYYTEKCRGITDHNNEPGGPIKLSEVDVEISKFIRDLSKFKNGELRDIFSEEIVFAFIEKDLQINFHEIIKSGISFNETNVIGFIKECRSMKRFKARNFSISILLNKIRTERSNRKSFSELIGTNPIFLDN